MLRRCVDGCPVSAVTTQLLGADGTVGGGRATGTVDGGQGLVARQPGRASVAQDAPNRRGKREGG